MAEKLTKISLKILVKDAMLGGEEDVLMSFIVEDLLHLQQTYISCLDDLDWVSIIKFEEQYVKEYAQYLKNNT